MQAVNVYSSSKLIVNVESFEGKDGICFGCKYADVEFKGEKSSSGKMIPTDVIKKLIVSKKNLGSNFEKLSEAEICQELKGKSVVTTISIADK